MDIAPVYYNSIYDDRYNSSSIYVNFKVINSIIEFNKNLLPKKILNLYNMKNRPIDIVIRTTRIINDLETIEKHQIMAIVYLPYVSYQKEQYLKELELIAKDTGIALHIVRGKIFGHEVVDSNDEIDLSRKIAESILTQKVLEGTLIIN